MERKILVTIEAQDIWDADIEHIEAAIEEAMPERIIGGDHNYKYTIEEVEEQGK